jgi:hypothetical protein
MGMAGGSAKWAAPQSAPGGGIGHRVADHCTGTAPGEIAAGLRPEFPLFCYRCPPRTAAATTGAA